MSFSHPPVTSVDGITEKTLGELIEDFFPELPLDAFSIEAFFSKLDTFEIPVQSSEIHNKVAEMIVAKIVAKYTTLQCNDLKRLIVDRLQRDKANYKAHREKVLNHLSRRIIAHDLAQLCTPPQVIALAAIMSQVYELVRKTMAEGLAGMPAGFNQIRNGIKTSSDFGDDTMFQDMINRLIMAYIKEKMARALLHQPLNPDGTSWIPGLELGELGSESIEIENFAPMVTVDEDITPPEAVEVPSEERTEAPIEVTASSAPVEVTHLEQPTEVPQPITPPPVDQVPRAQRTISIEESVVSVVRTPLIPPNNDNTQLTQSRRQNRGRFNTWLMAGGLTVLSAASYYVTKKLVEGGTSQTIAPAPLEPVHVQAGTPPQPRLNSIVIPPRPAPTSGTQGN